MKQLLISKSNRLSLSGRKSNLFLRSPVKEWARGTCRLLSQNFEESTEFKSRSSKRNSKCCEEHWLIYDHGRSVGDRSELSRKVRRLNGVKILS